MQLHRARSQQVCLERLRFHPPAFNDLIIYQLHFGVFYAKDRGTISARIGCVNSWMRLIGSVFADLGVTAIMPLPFQEYQTESSLGYNGTDLFSPEMDYAVAAGSAAVPGAGEPAAAGQGWPIPWRSSPGRSISSRPSSICATCTASR